MIFSEWLNENNQRCVLVELDASINGIESTLYLSNIGFASSPIDLPANTLYPAGLEGSIQLTESIALDGSLSIGYSDITINNTNGIRDAWLTYIFTNRAIRVYLGSPGWNKEGFELIFSGITANISSSSLDKINIQFLDKMQLLNTPLSEATVDGSGTNADDLLPNLFGECCNVTPLNYNPATLEYKVHTTNIERIIEVRDNGVPITTFTPYPQYGSFILTTAPAGTITASIQGDNVGGYTNTVASVIKRIVKGFGKASTRFTDADINLTNFYDFDATHQQFIGIYLANKENVLDIINRIAYSIGAYCFINRLGKLTLLQLTLPGSGTPIEIKPRNIINGSFTMASVVPITPAVKLGYCRNWTVQDKLETGLPDEHKALFAKEYLIVSLANNNVITSHKLSSEATQQDTLLLTKTQTTEEASRKLALFSTQRFIYSFDSFGDALLWELGQSVTLTYPRFTLQLGKNGVITKIQKDFVTGKVKVEVLG
jgi:hypothetical protein